MSDINDEVKFIGEGQQDNKKKKKNTIMISSSIEKLFSKFIGLTSYLSQKYIKIKKKELNAENTLNDPQKENGFLEKLINTLNFLFIIALFIVTLATLNVLSPANVGYSMNDSVYKLLNIDENITDQFYITKKEAMNDIKKRLSVFFTSNNLKIKAISPLRISFVLFLFN